ncbi:MAG TPA: MarR family transcriptional regulator [Verrucomicrobiae bacterium]|nr:MarR family transcriptional regulator [Verrucomicrobiae bacterium]
MQQLQRTIAPSNSAQQCAAEILEAVPAIIRFIRSEMRSHRGADLSVPQFRTLALLSRNQGASLSVVAEFLGLSLPATSRLVDGLVKKGLVTRQIPAGNRRQVALSVSTRGRTTWENARQATQQQLAEVIAPLTAAQRSRIQEAMRILQQSFQPETSASAA